MNDFLLIHRKLQELPQDWSLERAPQIFEPGIGLQKHLALTVGRFFIATGENLVRLASVPQNLEKKAV